LFEQFAGRFSLAGTSVMDVRVAPASAVIVQHVPPADRELFLEWQRGISRAVESFAGYSGTDIYPPCEASRDAWVVVMHFETEAALQNWLNSPVRREWLERMKTRLGQAQVTRLEGGFAAWFSDRLGGSAPANWQMALLVLLGLYPIVMLLTLYFPVPQLSRWGLAVSMLISNALSVSLLQWAVMPLLNRLFARWLGAGAGHRPRVVLGGLALIGALLVGICVLFRAASS
jgi:antibiotic biosynthesis monooxygenase (ABM) superfamily enzyme